MRLIDADALKQEWEYIDGIPAFTERDIDNASAVDAVPVVQCKDCKYAQHDTIFKDIWCDGKQRKPDWYCADGERRDDDATGSD